MNKQNIYADLETEKIIAPQEEVNEAVKYGYKIESEDETCKIVAYIYKGRTYICEIINKKEVKA